MEAGNPWPFPPLWHGFGRQFELTTNEFVRVDVDGSAHFAEADEAMSKKNNLKTRKNAHEFHLQREKELERKRAAKRERKQHAADNKMAVEGGTKKAKRKGKGIKLRKNVVFRGIKIKDAASKQQVKEMLQNEAGMEIDDL